jgi:WD40-like Beta Propeller Repeat
MHRRKFLFGALGAALALTSKASRTPQLLGLIAFVDNGGLCVRELPDGEPRNLVSGAVSFPSFSPSGKWISYQQGGQTSVISTDGKQVRNIGNFDVEWLPASDELWAVNNSQDGSALFSVGNDWSSPILTFPDRSSVVFNASGTEMVYIGDDPDGDDDHPLGRLCRTAVQEGAQPAVLQSTTEDWTPRFWTRDGKSIVIYRQEERSVSEASDGDELFLIPATGGKPRSLGVTALFDRDFLALSPTRNELAVTAGEERNEWHNKRMAVVDLDSFTVRNLTGPGMVGLAPSWSPDGNLIAYSAGPAPKKEEESDLECGCDDASQRRLNELLSERRIWVSDRMGTQPPRQLTGDSRYHDEEPRWSADGGHILFTRSDSKYQDIHTLSSSQKTLWLIGVDGDDPIQVAGPLYLDPDHLGDNDRWCAFDWYLGTRAISDAYNGAIIQPVTLPGR